MSDFHGVSAVLELLGRNILDATSRAAVEEGLVTFETVPSATLKNLLVKVLGTRAEAVLAPILQ